PAPGWIVRSASRASSGPCSIAWSSNASTADESSSASWLTSVSIDWSGSCSRSCAISTAALSRWWRPSYGVTQAFNRFNSSTEARAVSGLVQNPASACCDSRKVRRSVLPGRSKEVSQLEDPVLQLCQTLDEIGHVAYPVIGSA